MQLQFLKPNLGQFKRLSYSRGATLLSRMLDITITLERTRLSPRPASSMRVLCSAVRPFQNRTLPLCCFHEYRFVSIMKTFLVILIWSPHARRSALAGAQALTFAPELHIKGCILHECCVVFNEAMLRPWSLHDSFPATLYFSRGVALYLVKACSGFLPWIEACAQDQVIAGRTALSLMKPCLGLNPRCTSVFGQRLGASLEVLYGPWFMKFSAVKVCSSFRPSLGFGYWPWHSSVHSILVQCRTYNLVSNLWKKHAPTFAFPMAPFSRFPSFAKFGDLSPTSDAWRNARKIGPGIAAFYLVISGSCWVSGLSRSLAASSRFLGITGWAYLMLMHIYSYTFGPRMYTSFQLQ